MPIKIHSITQVLAFPLIILAVAIMYFTWGDTSSKTEVPSKAKGDAARKSTRTELSEQDQQLAMEFAREHHPELFRLLEQLQKSRPAEFSRGIRDLHQQTQNILRSKE